MNEVSYYPQLARDLEAIVASNLQDTNIHVHALYLPRDGSHIRRYLETYIAQHPGEVSDALIECAGDIPKLRTDIVLVFDNPVTNKFQLVIVEVKLVSSAGLSELSQLIGYSLVTKVEYGLLINVNGGISSELKDILLTDIDIAEVTRTLSTSGHSTEYHFGVLGYQSATGNFQYIETLAQHSLPQMVGEIESVLRAPLEGVSG